MQRHMYTQLSKGSEVTREFTLFPLRPMAPSRDRVSVLPDELLLHVLSFLPTTKERAATSLLSHRWRHLWTRVPSLDFSCTDFRQLPLLADECIRRYAGGPHIHRLSASVVSPRDCDLTPKEIKAMASGWIKFAAARSVRELSLRYDSDWKFSPFVLSCTRTLRVLKLHGCDLSTLCCKPSDTRFSCLETLVLLSVTGLSHRRLAALLRMCPELKNLKFSTFKRLSNVELVTSVNPCLRNVAIAASMKRLVIRLPELRCFYFFGGAQDVHLKDASQLHEAALAPDYCDSLELMPFSQALSAVNIFSTNGLFFQIYEKEEVEFTKKNLRVLHCDKMDVYCSFIPFFSFLKQCTSLEKLYIKLVYGSCSYCESEFDSYIPPDMHSKPFLPSGEDFTLGWNSTIKSIVIVRISDTEEVILLVRFLLETMAELEQLALIFEDMYPTTAYKPEEQMLQKVRGFYKASPGAKVAVKMSGDYPSLLTERVIIK